MKAHPILFSGPMVQAILAGWKSQTRRQLNPAPHKYFMPSVGDYQRPRVDRRTGEQYPEQRVRFGAFDDMQDLQFPYGRVGDRLWVRETHSISIGGGPGTPDDGTRLVRYRAGISDDIAKTERWRPSIFMPRWASRLTLEITAVRVERLQAISDGDALAEGIDIFEDGAGFTIPLKNGRPGPWQRNPVDAYRNLWELINGPDSWAANPWVWVISFRRVQS